ncbi:MAG: sugar phosphate isomerase/epimerase [Kiritimatiellae bacterium]|jgi:sugar phosphate isomerase/epimerase|nr:sugar phosphate isomerase/epimerase [Kiritimatiellia bacterium]
MATYVEPIRIGTLVNARDIERTKSYIKQIKQHGFESFQLSLSFASEVSVDLKALADGVKEAIGDDNIVISSLGVFGNPLETTEAAQWTREGFAKAIEACKFFDCDIVAGFAGRLIDQSIDKSMPRFKEVFSEIIEQAEANGVKIAFENCDMGGDWNRGDWNIAQNPTAWEMMFNEVNSDNIGLCWEPCHQMVSLIEPIPQLRKWVGKILNVHGKDATINWDVVREHGVHGKQQFAYHRTPGFGDSNWTDIITILRQNNYQGSIDIEGWHDPVYRGDLEMTGQVYALNYLKSCRGGTYVQNPS